jgi:hypothetical protein
MRSDYDDIVKLKKQLFPTGRAFNVPVGGNFEKLLLGLADKESESLNDGLAILDVIIPDNTVFSVADAAKWERVLSISGSEDDSLANRMATIYRKMQFPSNAKGRQHKNYLEGQLRDANFDVKIYEYQDVKNYFSATSHSKDTLHSLNTTHGGLSVPFYSEIVANYLDNEDEADILLTLDTLKNIFWVAGDTFDDFPNIPPYRIEEFRHIILTIKPLYTVAFLRIVNNDDWILADETWNMLGKWYNTATWKL